MHAAATPYRERSHFDGQDVLESGFAKPGAIDSGWLNRALLALAPAAASILRGARLRGRAGHAVGRARAGSGDVLVAATGAAGQRRHAGAAARSLSAHRSQARAARSKGASAWLRSAHAEGNTACRGRAAMPPPGIARVRAYFAEAAGTAANYLARPEGPRVGALGFVGWDTHVNEGARHGQLADLLGALDGAFAAIESNMGAAWRETVVVVITEFGRTARINGSNGTDHGTGTVALLAGGALKGGRVIADWPGLKIANSARRPRPRSHDRPARRAQGPVAGPPAGRGGGACRERFPDSAGVAGTAGLVRAV